MKSHSNHTCHVCGKNFANTQLRDIATVRPVIANLITAEYPTLEAGEKICVQDLSSYRKRYVEKLLEDERGVLNRLDREVIESLTTGELIATNVAEISSEELSFADKAADKLAGFGGSWTFILSFFFIIIVWMVVNVTHWLFKPFDPYPFILLNLVLSCLAAMQAPVIMMSQRRVEIKDRVRAESDYKINLKAELEIRQLHEKLDHQLANQWQRLLDIQQIQIEMLEDKS